MELACLCHKRTSRKGNLKDSRWTRLGAERNLLLFVDSPFPPLWRREMECNWDHKYQLQSIGCDCLVFLVGCVLNTSRPSLNKAERIWWSNNYVCHWHRMQEWCYTRHIFPATELIISTKQTFHIWGLLNTKACLYFQPSPWRVGFEVEFLNL